MSASSAFASPHETLRHIKVPFHSNFDEVNLRIYVRRNPQRNTPRRGLHPRDRSAAGCELRWHAGMRENYRLAAACATRSRLTTKEVPSNIAGTLKQPKFRFTDKLKAARLSRHEGSLEQFISEHYWGYSRRRRGDSIEYHVAHDSWRVWRRPMLASMATANRFTALVSEASFARRPRQHLSPMVRPFLFSSQAHSMSISSKHCTCEAAHRRLDPLRRRMQFLFSLGTSLGTSGWKTRIRCERSSIRIRLTAPCKSRRKISSTISAY